MKNCRMLLTSLFLMSALSAPAVAQNKKTKAKRLFDEGVAALDRADYETAVTAFEEAYKTIPHWAVLAHIGSCYAKLSRPVESIQALERFLAEGGEDIRPDERDIAIRLLEEQKKKVGILHLVVKPNGTQARIDGESVGYAPFKKIPLSVGPHRISIAHGDKTMEKDVYINPGEEVTVRYPKQEEAPAAPAVAPPIKEPTSTPTPQPTEPKQEVPDQDTSDEWTSSSFSQSGTRDIVPRPAISPPPPNDTSGPYWVAFGVAMAGLATAGVGWPLFIYYNNSENNYADAISGDTFDGFSWTDTCRSGDTSVDFDEDEQAEVYFCNQEQSRRYFEKMRKRMLIMSIAGTSVAVAAGTTALIFYFHPEWFSSKNDRVKLRVTPVANASFAGLMLGGTF
ncbi:MAG: hypothetical protein QNJ97_17450 [Myxococcota bacterium]|nr:hypothetical protein [Myxococcota bacterium]